jgi:hypothetical protein
MRAGFAVVAALLLVASSQVSAKVTSAEAVRLGKELTPVGAIKAGNADGSIPEWTPVNKEGKPAGEFPRDPQGFALSREPPLYTISASNLDKYADQLTEGHKLLLRRYGSYHMNVYRSYRLVNWPDAVLKATVENATRADLQGPDVPDGAELGFPFPIPRSGAEPIWNHKLKWRGEAVQRTNAQLIVQPDGSFVQSKLVEDFKFYYASIADPQAMSTGVEFLRYLSRALAPQRIADTITLVQERSSTGSEGRNAWLRPPRLKRVSRTPSVCCDNPNEVSDGNQLYDQIDMFNGVLERYDWTLLGRKEMLVPYDSIRIGSNAVHYQDLVRPQHLNPELPRYELHRVWIVEANLKPGAAHVFKRRRFYIDEDSWTIVAVDDYDNRDQLLQFQEGHLVLLPSILSVATTPEVIYHFDSGRYFITGLYNEDSPPNFTVHLDDQMLTPAAVQKNLSN